MLEKKLEIIKVREILNSVFNLFRNVNKNNVIFGNSLRFYDYQMNLEILGLLLETIIFT